jgi:hypothetical protein
MPVEDTGLMLIDDSLQAGPDDGNWGVSAQVPQ